MPFTLHPATVEDASDIAAIFRAAFAEDHIMGYFHPHVPASVVLEKDTKLFRGLIAEGDIYGERITKVVDEESGMYVKREGRKTVAFSTWQYPHTLTEDQRKEKEAKSNSTKDEPPEGSNKELIKDFFTQIFAGRKRWIVPEKTFFLHTLAVHPSHHRRGIGSMLIRPGLEAADKAGAQTYIEASPAGLPLYLRHGWEQVDDMVIDMRPYGGQGIEHLPFLMREPGARSKLGKVEG